MVVWKIREVGVGLGWVGGGGGGGSGSRRENTVPRSAVR